ncbi:hypothetical protein PC116_g17096 [Phytophthora cactorum]|uniref:Uncharacterized protein n=1 Tax=Phytophthora cactorum TaxID=29920 RepID=A0A8T0YT94_9STRA|nr:hypothetical protein PC111_g13046 [Phytophthora cactorum]KAG2817342.1 hypothetical protein PC112_g13092 [Phytophthora cactorum]KAG2853241.1 hypothetical protein PC113_g14323 [Phytophthora cactorum]KAG2896041.1 hypothetical protein PC114_g15262 [Phytophthora cactorum]KAG2930250.1 hypothetical protein PC117_g13742 [Phytophthora cactorum]
METTLQQRWTRFAEEDLGTFVTCSTLFTFVQTGKEFHAAKDKLLPTTQRVTLALRRTGPKDFSRDNVFMALPVCGALLNVHRGSRAMAKGALGLAALGYGADYIFSIYHRLKFEDALRQHEEEQALLRFQASNCLELEP